MVVTVSSVRREMQIRDRERFSRGVSATSLHCRALGLFDGAASLGSRGVPIGPYLNTAGVHCYDPFELYDRKDETGLTDPNAMIFGRIGQRKSTLAKAYARRQWTVGRYVRIIDPRGEYVPLAQDCGGTVIRIAPGQGVTLNPLASAQDRHELLRSVARASLPRPLSAREPALINAALDECVSGMEGEPTLPDVLHFLFHPTPAMAERLAASPESLALEARDVAMALQPLCEGDLAGMFDGPTSVDIDFDNRMIVIDLSEQMNSASLGVLLACAQAFMQASIDRQRRADEKAGQAPAKTILLIDEAWRIFAIPGVAGWLQTQVKLARKYGQQLILIMHRKSDLDAAGDDGSQVAKIIRGLLEDVSTFILFRLENDELDATAEMLDLSETEREVVADLQPGESLWRVAGRPFVVQTAVTAGELPLTYTDAGMQT